MWENAYKALDQRGIRPGPGGAVVLEGLYAGDAIDAAPPSLDLNLPRRTEQETRRRMGTNA